MDPDAADYTKVLCPHAKKLRDETVSLFLHPSWEKEHIERCIAGVKQIIDKHLK